MKQNPELDPKIASQIPSIADALVAGLISYVHRETFEVLEMADQESVAEFGEDAWEADRERVFQDPFSWISVQKLSSSEGFRIMADFAESLPGSRLRDNLENALSSGKPFRNFKAIIDASSARDDWFAFRDEAHRDYVRRIFERELQADDADDEVESEEEE